MGNHVSKEFREEDELLLLCGLYLASDVFSDEESVEGYEPRQKRTRLTYERPDYKQSTWWIMLARGLCSNSDNRENLEFHLLGSNQLL